MEKLITPNSIYLSGAIKDVLKELKKMSFEFATVQEIINKNLN